MNPLSIILKHHVDTYRGAVDHGIPQGLALNIINNQLDGDYTSYARKFQKKYNVDKRLGMMLSKMSKTDGYPELGITIPLTAVNYILPYRGIKDARFTRLQISKDLNRHPYC